MKNPVLALRRRANRLIEAKIEESWAGSQDPEIRTLIAQEVIDAQKSFDDVISIITHLLKEARLTRKGS